MVRPPMHEAINPPWLAGLHFYSSQQFGIACSSRSEFIAALGIPVAVVVEKGDRQYWVW